MNATHTIGINTLAVASIAAWTDWRKFAAIPSVVFQMPCASCRKCHQTAQSELGKCDQSVTLSSWRESKFAIPLISIPQALIIQTLSPREYPWCQVEFQMLIEKRAARCVRIV
jgi:hypothetical protein